MRHTSRALAVVAAVAAMALTACSGGGTAQSGQSGSNSANGPALSDLNIQPRDALKQGGNLRRTITSWPTCW